MILSSTSGLPLIRIYGDGTSLSDGCSGNPILMMIQAPESNGAIDFKAHDHLHTTVKNL